MEEGCHCVAWGHTRRGIDWTSAMDRFPDFRGHCAECAALCSQNSDCDVIECQNTEPEQHCLWWKTGRCDTDASADMFMIDGHQTCRPDASVAATSRVWTPGWGERFNIRNHREGDHAFGMRGHHRGGGDTYEGDAYQLDGRNSSTSGSGPETWDHDLLRRKCGVLSWLFGAVVMLGGICSIAPCVIFDACAPVRPQESERGGRP